MTSGQREELARLAQDWVTTVGYATLLGTAVWCVVRLFGVDLPAWAAFSAGYAVVMVWVNMQQGYWDKVRASVARLQGRGDDDDEA